jgi:DNA-binding response OmpR family regulator
MLDRRTASETALRIVVMDDDPSQAELMRLSLELAGHRARRCDRVHGLLHTLEQDRCDVLVLEWDNKETGGVEAIRRVRTSRQPNVPVLFASARNLEQDVVTAFRHGADAFVAKPARLQELVARVEVLGRRANRHHTKVELLELGPYRADSQMRTLLRCGRVVSLTSKDFDLSVFFLRNVGRLLSRQEIRESVWGSGADLTSRTLDTHVSRVRRRLALTADNGWCLAAVYGFGYRLTTV